MQQVSAGSTDARREVWRFVRDRLKRRGRVVLLALVESTGDTPGKVGFRMAADAKGGLAGTIGGGAMERDLVDEAHRMLGATRPAPRVVRKVHLPGHPDASGMICGGRQTAVLLPCRRSDLPAVEALLSGGSGRLVLSQRNDVLDQEIARQRNRDRAGERVEAREEQVPADIAGPA